MKTVVETIYKPNSSTRYRQPLFKSGVSAGFPSPAADYEEGRLDLNKHLIRNPAATFFVRVNGDSMIGAGIHTGEQLAKVTDGSPVRYVITNNNSKSKSFLTGLHDLAGAEDASAIGIKQ